MHSVPVHSGMALFRRNKLSPESQIWLGGLPNIIPPESGNSSGFRQESVGQGKDLQIERNGTVWPKCLRYENNTELQNLRIAESNGRGFNLCVAPLLKNQVSCTLPCPIDSSWTPQLHINSTGLHVDSTWSPVDFMWSRGVHEESMGQGKVHL